MRCNSCQEENDSKVGKNRNLSLAACSITSWRRVSLLTVESFLLNVNPGMHERLSISKRTTGVKKDSCSPFNLVHEQEFQEPQVSCLYDYTL